MAKRAGTKKSKKSQRLVGVIMGSDSDWKVMEAATTILEDFEISFESRVVSAHRTPEAMLDYAHTAQARGLKVIIAGAGGAAHLPGMIASATSLPVIGVPVNVTALDGLDALLSVVQMPKGVPVATMAIDNAANAGLLAVRILALSDSRLDARLAQYRLDQMKKVEKADRSLNKSKRKAKPSNL